MLTMGWHVGTSTVYTCKTWMRDVYACRQAYVGRSACRYVGTSQFQRCRIGQARLDDIVLDPGVSMSTIRRFRFVRHGYGWVLVGIFPTFLDQCHTSKVPTCQPAYIHTFYNSSMYTFIYPCMHHKSSVFNIYSQDINGLTRQVFQPSRWSFSNQVGSTMTLWSQWGTSTLTDLDEEL